MIEDELRAAFARHETLTPATAPVRAAIERTVVRRRRRRFRLRLGGTALALVAAALAGFTAVAPQHRETGNLLTEPAASAPAGALNLLLLGLDGATPDGARRADSLLLVHVPADRSRLYLVSLPRDLYVPVPGVGTTKLNSSFAYGSHPAKGDLTRGYDLTRRVVTEVTGIPIDAGAVLTYPALRKLTDAVGGVPVCLPKDVKSAHTGRVFPDGCQQLDGAASVDLLRQRYGMTDARDRDRNAQRYAAGLLRRIGERGGLTDPAMLNTLLRQVGTGLTVETGQTSLPTLLSVAGKAAAAEPVAVGLPVVHTERPLFGWQLDREAAPEFLAALREDRLDQWTAAHPKQVTGLR